MAYFDDNVASLLLTMVLLTRTRLKDFKHKSRASCSLAVM